MQSLSIAAMAAANTDDVGECLGTVLGTLLS